MNMNTALRAEETKAMIFISEAHEKLREVRCEDEYHHKLLAMSGGLD